MTRRHGALVCGLATGALVAACGESDRLTAPALPARPPAILADWTVGPLGEPFALAAPAENNLPTPPTSTAIEIAAGVPARVTVSGYLTFLPNPAYFACPGHVQPFVPTPNPVGPAGLDNAERVRAYGVVAGLGDATNPPTSAIALGPLQGEAATISGFVQGPGVLWVSRPQVIGGAVGGPGCGDYNPAYFLTGSQAVSAEALEPPVATPDKLRVPPGDTVTFEVTIPWTTNFFVRLGWRWVSDTTTNTSSLVGNCARQVSCRAVVRERGHAEVDGVVAEGVIELGARSPVIEVEPVELELLLTPTSVRPVVAGAGCFDAVAQRAYRPLNRAERDATGLLACADQVQQRAIRTDIVHVTVRGRFAPSGTPAANVAVDLAAAGTRDTTGGHRQHLSARPKGTFFLPGEDANQDGRPAGRNGVISVRLSAAGEAELTYRTSGVSGQEKIAARLQIQGAPLADSGFVAIEIAGLAELREEGNVDTIGVTTTHPDHHRGTPGMVAALRALADSFHAKYGILLLVNDMSLPLGGLFDLDNDWSSFGASGHMEHREGRSADVDALSSAQFVYIEEKWDELSSHARAVYAEGSHYHLRF